MNKSKQRKSKQRKSKQRKSKQLKSKYKNKNKTLKSKTKSLKKNNVCPPGMEKIKTNEDVLCVGKCPHSGGPIYYNPKLDKLVCKWHGSQFMPQTGKNLTPPAQSYLKIKKFKN